MTLGFICRLEHGKDVLDLHDNERFLVEEGFTPPTISQDVRYAHGSGANEYSGAEFISEKAINRDWAFGVTILGDSQGEINKNAGILQAFIGRYRDRRYPLHLVFCGSDSIPFEPTWGQPWRRYQIVRGRVDLPAAWGGVGRIGPLLEDAIVDTTIKPVALGNWQIVGQAQGGITEEWLGTADRHPRGLLIPEGTTNKMTNPVFGHSTWNNGWTTQASLISAENTDSEYILFEKSSALLISAGTSNIAFYQSIDVGNTNTHTLSCFVKRPGGGAVTASVCALVYGTAQTTTYTPVGGGWYRLSCQVTGINAATPTGIRVEDQYTIYVDGFQIEQKGNSTPLCYGMMLDCSWSGTEHASTSSRTAARYRVPVAGIMNSGEGTISFAWRANRASSDYGGGEAIFFIVASTTWRFAFNSTTNKWRFSDGTTATESASTDSFAEGDIIIFHVTWGAAGIKVYKNGSEVLSISTYAPPAFGTHINIGSTAVPDTWSRGIFLGFRIYDRAITAAQALADYNDIQQLVTGGDGYGRRFDWMPWFWTKDGDNVLDNVDDSDQDNYGVSGGIPGDLPAETEWQIQPSVKSKAAYWLGIVPAPVDNFRPSADQHYFDIQGTADSDTSGGEARSFNIVTYEFIAPAQKPENILRKSRVHLLCRLRINVVDQVSMIMGLDYGSQNPDLLEQRIVTAATAYRLYYLGDLVWDPPQSISDEKLSFNVYGLFESIDTADTVFLDYVIGWPGNLLRYSVIEPSSWDTAVIREKSAYALFSGSVFSAVNLRGDVINLHPASLNYILHILGDDDETNVSTNTATFSEISVRPRWALL